MNFLIDPNVSYLLLVGGIILITLALCAPGTGVIEVIAIAAIALAGIGIANLPINIWALALLPIGLIAFVFALRRKPFWLYLLIAAITLILGSVFTFRDQNGSPAINPVLAIVTNLVAIGLLWLVFRKVLAVFSIHPTHSLERLAGMTGYARNKIHAEGTVHIDGEEWSARSKDPIPAGSKVRITGRDGLVLIVEAISSAEGQDLNLV